MDIYERTYLGLATFLLGATLCGLLLAELGTFNAYLVGLGGLAGSGGFLHITRRPPGSSMRWSPMALILLICSLGYAAAFFLPPFNWILGGLDPGVYVNTAAQLSASGSLLIRDPLVIAAALAGPSASAFLPWGIHGFLPGYYIHNGVIVPQFYHTYPVLLAFINALLGLQSALHLTPVLAFLDGFGFFLLARRWLGGRFGPILALAVLASNVSFVWFARFPNSEMLALQFLLAGLLANHFSEQEETQKSALGWSALSAAFFGAAFLTRIDMIYLFPALVVGWLMSVWRGKFRLNLAWLSMFCIFLLWTYIHAYFFSFPYFYDVFNRNWVWPFLQRHPVSSPTVGLALFGILLALTWILKPSNTLRQTIQPWIQQGRALLLPATVLVLLGLTTSYYLFRWQTLDWLGWYCGIPVLALSVVGVISWAKGAAKGSHVPVSLAIFLIACITVLVVLGPNPRVRPVHFWASRRLLVFVFPPISLFAGLGLLEAFRWMGRTGVAALLAMAIFPGVYNIAPFVGFQMFKGAGQDLKRFADHIPKNDIVIYHSPNYLPLICTPLRFLYQKSILPMRRDEVPASGIDWLKKNFPGREILVGTFAGHIPRMPWPYLLSRKPIARVPIKWSLFATVGGELPRSTQILKGDLELWGVRVWDGEMQFQATAAELESLGIHVAGFYIAEHGRGDHWFRWTNGQGELLIPRMLVKESRMLYVVLADNRPHATETEIFLNSQPLGAVRVEAGRLATFSHHLPDDWLGDSANAKLEIRTPPWVPAEVSHSTDTRKLGVMLLEVRFPK
jgi:hypothetical protein